MKSVQDAVIVFLQRMTIACRQRSIRRKICPRDQRLGSDPQVGERPISFDALTEDPIPLKGRVLWKRRMFMVRTTASAKD